MRRKPWPFLVIGERDEAKVLIYRLRFMGDIEKDKAAYVAEILIQLCELSREEFAAADLAGTASILEVHPDGDTELLAVLSTPQAWPIVTGRIQEWTFPLAEYPISRVREALISDVFANCMSHTQARKEKARGWPLQQK